MSDERVQHEPGRPAVVVTGVGPVSALGCGRDTFWEALVAGRPGFAPITLCDTRASPSRIAAEVRGFRLGDHLPNGAALARRLTRPAQLALAASALALQDAGLDPEDRDRAGVCAATSIGSLGDALTLSAEIHAGDAAISSQAAFHLMTHSTACIVSSYFDLRGLVHTATTGCNSTLDALGYALRAIQMGLADSMLVVGSDCEIHADVMAVLNAAHLLSTGWNDAPERASRPFDVRRDGNVLGEGAGALVLETEAAARRRGARVYARLAAHHACAAGRRRRYDAHEPEPDARPFVRALRGAMAEAGWRPEDIDLVSANGSSSVIYDRLEAIALEQAFGAAFTALRVHSIKSMLGQHGAGSSALQAVAACLGIERGIVPPTINCDALDPACGPLRLVTRAESFRARRVLTHAIGMGGFYASAVGFAAPQP